MPGADGSGVSGLIGLLSETLYDYSSGTRAASAVSAEADLEQMAPARDSLIEGIITESEDETLMERYLSGETVATGVLISDLVTAVARGSFYPVLAVSSPLGIGMAELLEIITQAFPSPLAHPLPPVTSAVTGDTVERALLRPGRAAARRGREDHLRPLRRADLARARVLRDAAPRHVGARLRARAGRAGAPGP